jgi:3-methyladenine DNA glycosylase AlkD
MVKHLIKAILDDLKRYENPKRAEISVRYMKTSKLRFWGCSLPQIRSTAKKHVKGVSTENLLPIMESLWEYQIFEPRMAGIQIIEIYSKKGDISIALDLISRWIDDIDTWSLTDPLCTVCLGTLLIRDPKKIEPALTSWRKSENFWRRRATILPYLHLSKKSFYKKEYLERIIDAMRPHLTDKEFFVGKAVGWVLRELSKREPKAVRAFIDENRDTATKLVIREGMKKLKKVEIRNGGKGNKENLRRG